MYVFSYSISPAGMPKVVAAMRSLAMRGDWRISGGALALFAAVAALLPAVSQAQPISAEVARKCKILRAKQFPPRQIGNPAAGSAHDSGQDKREFFRRCVENGGNVAVTPPLQ
jgi:hypothetical protein